MSESTISASQIDYKQALYSHPEYRMTPQFPNNYGQPLPLLAASQSVVTINIPPEVFNMGESFLQYVLKIAAPAAGFTWTHEQALSAISHIQWFSGNGQYICDLDNVQNYLDIVIKKEESQNNFLTFDKTNGVYPNNCKVEEVPASRNSNYSSFNVNNGPQFPSSLAYREPAYITHGAATSAVTKQIQFPLSLLKNTAFAIGKDIYCGTTTYLKLFVGPLSKVGYASTTGDFPSNGTKSPIVAAAEISDLQLILAIESNEELRAKAINKVMTGGGLSYMIPYIQSYKNTVTAAERQTVTIPLDVGS